MGNNKVKVWLPLMFSVVMVLGMIIGYQLRDKTQGSRFLTINKRTALQELVELIRNKYVDPVKVDSITQVTADELLSRLDPHSVYIPAKDLMEVNEELMGNFQGIGVEFQLLNDTVHVMNVMKGGPSEKAGIMVGDRLIKVDDSIVIAGKKIKPDDVRAILRGPAESKVQVNILRGQEEKKVTIQRGVIPVPTVDVSYMITPVTGFIRINRFGEPTYEEFMQQLEKLQALGMKELILDLRGNGGGLLKEATDIADEFLDGDKLIVYTEGEHVPKMEYRCKRDGLFEKGKLVVLVDETSASASEVLSGALQDWDRATIIGRRSFGKGLVQQQFQLSDGSAVRLTIARYFTPLGRSIQKAYDKGKSKYEQELVNRWHNGELVKADTVKPSGKSYKTPGGKIVYGGGGITPDMFVPYDTSKLDTALTAMYYKSTMNNFVYRLYLQDAQKFKAYKTPEDLYKQFNPGETEWKQLVDFAAKDSIRLNGASSKDKALLLKTIQLMMARQIWRTQGYYEVQNKTDQTIKKALEVLQ